VKLGMLVLVHTIAHNLLVMPARPSVSPCGRAVGWGGGKFYYKKLDWVSLSRVIKLSSVTSHSQIDF